MGFPRGTTPTITFELDDDGYDIDLTKANNIYVTFESGFKSCTKTGNALTITPKTVTVTLSQQETLAFKDRNVKIQINWTYANGARWSSECVNYTITEQLLNRVVD